MSAQSPTTAAALRRENLQRYTPFIVFGTVLVCTILLWRDRVGGAVIVGQAEAVRAAVSTPKPGVVIAVKTGLLERVKQGDVLAQVVPADLEAQIAELGSRVESLRAQLVQSADRATVDYQQLRLDWLRRNADLASVRVEQQLAESEYQRYLPLHQSRVVSDAEFEARRANRDALKSKVDALVRLVGDLQREIKNLQPKAAAESPADRAISAAIIAQQKQLEALSDSANLKAPMDGIVTTLFKRPGENAVLGERVLEIGNVRSTRIVAYLRQPFNVTLKPGDYVDVAARGANHAAARARVLQVGAQLEAIAPALLPPTSSTVRVAEFGLPLLVEIPSGLNLAPGEIVNITARTRATE